jgi:hypothetical protein
MTTQSRFDVDAVIAEAAERNRLRRQACLPALVIDDEISKARLAFERRQFAVLMRSPLRAAVEQRLLGRERRRGGNPDWAPTGVLSGGGYLFHARVRRTLHRFLRRFPERGLGV